jgi:hypothetical protein
MPRFEHDGMSLWWGEKDTPAATKSVEATVSASVIVGVYPPVARPVFQRVYVFPKWKSVRVFVPTKRCRVRIRYRVNRGTVKEAPAFQVKERYATGPVIHFEGYLPPFKVDDVVQYGIVCRCGSRQVPAPDDADLLPSSFVVKHRLAGRQKSSTKGRAPKRRARRSADKDSAGKPPVIKKPRARKIPANVPRERHGRVPGAG